ELSRRASAAVLIGPAGDDTASALDAATAGPRAPHLPIRRVAGLADAVSAAQALAQPGDVVLLSPACAAREDITRAKTIDAFNSADERGERFVALVRELAKGAPARGARRAGFAQARSACSPRSSRSSRSSCTSRRGSAPDASASARSASSSHSWS